MTFTDFASSREWRLLHTRLDDEERLLLSDLRALAENGKNFNEVALAFTRIGGQLLTLARQRSWLQQQLRSEQSSPSISKVRSLPNA